MIGVAALKRNVAWIITQDGILIGEQRPFGRVRKRMISSHDIADVRVRERFSYPVSFSLVFRLTSGDVLTSPPLPDITRVNETTAIVTGLLGLPDAAPVDNPLEAGNAEIILGSPVNPDFGRVIRMTVPVVAGLCALPFLIVFWIGDAELALGLLLPLGFLAAFALYRYAYRLAGSFWIIGRGEIRVERLALNGEPSAETIRAGDVAAIEVGEPDGEDRTCTISIRLHTGQTFRCPTKQDENGARALRAEIIRRLNAAPDAGTLSG
ncbi:hypothetical protein LJR220_006689 [Bradyrhizobium sp. LjRoot220]|uniref:hypothetical protein n=1 Tax=Bradyrhizobium sp. LjRoot220 TaxID=3342284 RepID=UPI003ECC750F